MKTERNGKLVWRPATSIAPAPWNVRRNHDLDGIAESIRVNAFRDPIEVWATENGEPRPLPHEIVVGEGRFRAAVEKLGMADVPVIEHDFADLDAAKRYSIANNRLTDKSDFDPEALLAQLEELPTLEGTGFDLHDLEALRVPDSEFKEYDESAADDVKFIECPKCGHKWPA